MKMCSPSRIQIQVGLYIYKKCGKIVGKKNWLTRTRAQRKERKTKLAGSNPCSQICHAPEKKRSYSCMLIGNTYRLSALMVGHFRY